MMRPIAYTGKLCQFFFPIDASPRNWRAVRACQRFTWTIRSGAAVGLETARASEFAIRKNSRRLAAAITPFDRTNTPTCRSASVSKVMGARRHAMSATFPGEVYSARDIHDLELR
jgi:hypothetical protein